jgi:hypothetical protein
MSNQENEKKARKQIADAQRQLIEASRILNDHAATVFLKKAIQSADEALEWLETKEPSEA